MTTTTAQLPLAAPGTEKKTDWAATNVKIDRYGSKIILPNDPTEMGYDDAIEAIKRIKKDEETEFAVQEEIDAFVLDGAVAFWKAIHQKHGFASPIPTITIFGKKPPSMITVKTGPGPEDSIQVPWGKMVIPNFDAPVETGVKWNDAGILVFTVSGTLRRKNADMLKSLCELAREIVKEESIYRGKAFSLPVDGDGDLKPMASPEFIPTDNIREEELILNRNIETLIETALFTPIRKTDKCVEHGIPIKRGVLLEGKYGTGKSLTATKTARVCVENGWTFILLPRVEALAHALKLAKRYAPAVVFAEDIDRFLEERTDAANDLLNLMSGVEAKDLPLITVLTTNFADKLDRAMIRPGRIDVVVSFEPPDAEACQRLIRLYGRNLVDPNETLDAIGRALAGEIPATIREVVERSKLAMISRDGEMVSEADLLTTAQGMGRHLSILNSEKIEKREDAVGRMAEAVYDMIREASGYTDLNRGLDLAQELVGVARSDMRVIDKRTKDRDDEQHTEIGNVLERHEKTLDRIAQRVGV